MAVIDEVRAERADAAEGRLLAPYRILDLTDERGMLAGWMLAQLGAEVVQVEPLGGSPARRIGPFDETPAGAGRSLFWSAYAAGKQGLALAYDTPEGKALLLRLVEQADVLIESASPGVMAAIGLDHAVLSATNPRLVHVSITAYGSDGPKAHYADSDLTVWAAAGPLAPHRAPGGGPLRISVPQAFHNAAADAAVGALLALHARAATGRGQHVDVAAQSSCTLCTLFAHLAHAVGHDGYSTAKLAAAEGGKKKQLDLSGSGSRTQKTKWDAKDGMIEMHVGMGTAAGRFSNALFAWLHEIGECSERLAALDWIKVPQMIDDGTITIEEIEQARADVAPVLARYTMDELVTIAQDKGLMLAPVLTTGDLTRSPQLAARDFFVEVEEDGVMRTLPSPFAASGVDTADMIAAPTLGRDDAAVLGGWLGLAREEVAALAARGIVA